MKRRDLDRIVSLVDNNLDRNIRVALHLHENMALSCCLDGTLYSQKKMRFLMFLKIGWFLLLHPLNYKQIVVVYLFRKERGKYRGKEYKAEEIIENIAKRTGFNKTNVESIISKWMISMPLTVIKWCAYNDFIDWLNMEKAKGAGVYIYSDYSAEYNPQKAIFLDRDGTINKYVGFLRDINQFELLPRVAEAIRLINASGYLAIVVTNQPVIARGEVTTSELDTIHKKMETLLGLEGAYIDALYYCPHHPDKGFEGEIKELKIECECRKPKPGMLIKASEDYNICLEESWMIGDGKNDVECGINAGCHTVLLRNAFDDIDDSVGEKADFTAVSLLEAINRILQ